MTIDSLITDANLRERVFETLPKHLSPERFLRIATGTFAKDDKFKNVTKESLVNCLLDLSALGLEADGRVAHLIPYNNTELNQHECQLIIDYKGLVELAMRSGKVSKIHADKVCENDQFAVNKGVLERHEINYFANRGKVIGYYALIQFKDGAEKLEVMSYEEVMKIKKRSKAAHSGPWITDEDEMGKKTVFRRACKWLPLSPHIQEALEKDFDKLPEKNITPHSDVQQTQLEQTIIAKTPDFNVDHYISLIKDVEDLIKLRELYKQEKSANPDILRLPAVKETFAKHAEKLTKQAQQEFHNQTLGDAA